MMIPSAALTYAERATAYAKAHRPRGKPLVIDRQGDRPQWQAWRRYFKQIGLCSTVPQMDRAAKWTVPCDWPWDFDPEYPKPYSHMKGATS